MLAALSRFFGKELAMDLGTANTLIFVPGQGVVLNEPSVVALDADSKAVLAVGSEAKEFLGRTPRRIKAVRPLKDGVIADFDVTQKMVSFFIAKCLKRKSIFRPRMAICVPTGITQVEKRAVLEAANQAGVTHVRLIEEPMAAGIGASLPIHEPIGNMVVDIGGGTSEMAIITLSAIAYSESLRVAGDAMNTAIQRYFQDEFQLLVGENMAERVKISIGSALPLAQPLAMDVPGKDMVNGAPRPMRVTDAHIREALFEPVQMIVNSIYKALEKTPPELAGDIVENGILMAGGGSLLKGFDTLVHKVTGLKVVVDDDPLTTVVRGTGRTLEEPIKYEGVYIN